MSVIVSLSSAAVQVSTHALASRATLLPSSATTPQADWYWSNSRVTPPSTMTVWPDENPEVGRILDHRGKLLRVVKAKPEHHVGFKPGER